MRDDNSLIEELRQEEAVPVENAIAEQQQETGAEIAFEDDTQMQAEAAEENPEPEAQLQEGVIEDMLADENVPQEEAPVTEENSPAEQEDKAVPYHERYYLKYREGKRSTPLD